MTDKEDMHNIDNAYPEGLSLQEQMLWIAKANIKGKKYKPPIYTYNANELEYLRSRISKREAEETREEARKIELDKGLSKILELQAQLSK